MKTNILVAICLIIALVIEAHHLVMGWGFWDWNQVIHHETAIIIFVAFAGGLLTDKFLTPENT